MNILPNIEGHDDLQNLTQREQTALCDEIRDFLVDSVSKTGGHLASNLGMVELSVAIETVYNTNIDRLVFDVGHQSYVHKLLTGRQADFARLRQYGGMAGFPKPSESETDAFVAGHASSSVSIALGMARARTLQKQEYDVVTVIGDGAATGGMAYEALNDAAVSKEPMVIILNDNEMSIAPNVGGFAQHLARMRSKESYLDLKQRYRKTLSKTGFGRWIYRGTRKMKEWLKKILLQPTLFENMGLTYLGPVDGHDLPGLISLLRLARDMRRPVVLHVHTQKGKGYAPAEANPSKYHGIGKFYPETGLSVSQKKTTFSDVFGKTMVELSKDNHQLCAITAAMPDGTGLLEFMQINPARTFDVGIAEEHAVSMAGGLAKQGMIPVVALYSTFLQRGYDQILQDIAMLRLHVVLAVDRAGLVGEDGETHHGIYDVGFLRQAQGMRVLCPVSTVELADMLRWAVEDCRGPVAVRYPRGGDGLLTESCWDGGPAVTYRRGPDGLIVTYGMLTNEAIEAADILLEKGIRVSVMRLLQINPLPLESVCTLYDGQSTILIAEEAIGGIAESLAWQLSLCVHGASICVQDLGRENVTHGDLASLYKQHGLDAKSLAEKFMEVRKVEK